MEPCTLGFHENHRWFSPPQIRIATIIPKVTSDIWDTLQWRHNGRYDVSNDQPHHCVLIRLFRRRSKKTSKLHATGLCEGNSTVTGEFPTQKARIAEIMNFHSIVLYGASKSIVLEPEYSGNTRLIQVGDALYSCVARSPATKLFVMQDKRVPIFHEDGFKINALQNANVFYDPIPEIN